MDGRRGSPGGPELHPDAALAEILTSSSHPMTVVTARTGDRRAGCLVGLHTQCSIDPMRYLVCLSRLNRTYRIASDATVLAVHHLAEDQIGLARLFGHETSDEVDKFARCRWQDGPEGAIVLTSVANRWVGRIEDIFDLGDHRGFVLRPIAAVSGGPFRRFGSEDVATMDAGHPRSPEASGAR